MTGPTGERLDLLDWKRRTFALYAEVRREAGDPEAWRRWRAARDELFRSHPQSPLPASERSSFPGIPYFDHDPAWRILADVVEAEPERHDLPASTDDPGVMAFTRFARASFRALDEPCTLDLYWLEGYGGGLFVPFSDPTCGTETYGAGRYVLDTVKGADLGMEDGRLVVDFNYAYNPSCSYDPRRACPLAPPANRLAVAVRAGERSSPG